MTSRKNETEPVEKHSQQKTIKTQPEQSPNDLRTQDNQFPIVGFSASGENLHAFEQFFGALPDHVDMAFVIVQQAEPGQEEKLVAVLQDCTEMHVGVAQDGRKVEPNHVYVRPAGASLLVEDGVLSLDNGSTQSDGHNTADKFLRSLAEDRKENAVCIILSGTGDDGCIGLKRVKELGGIVMVQEPRDAENDEMPLNALSTGLVDLVAPASELADRLLSYESYGELSAADDSARQLDPDQDEVLRQIFVELRVRTGHDFSHYKRTTIQRRLYRRMRVSQIPDIQAYLRYLQDHEEEAKALVKDFLISVTRFYRDGEAFQALEKEVIPRLLQNKKSGDQIRIWAPGCATGEEAYSLAMLLAEAMERDGVQFDVQVFATDIDEAALAIARRALYPVNIMADVPRRRLEQFFNRETVGYRVRKEIQQMVLFAHHDLLKDPPFSRLDLISCRNLLIYLNRDVQKRIFEICHYALLPKGYLFLGSAETADRINDLFNIVNKEHRIYQRRPGPNVLPRLPKGMPVQWQKESAVTGSRVDEEDGSDLGAMHRSLLWRQYMPASVIIDRNYDIRHLIGDTGPYLQPPEGKPTHNLLQMVPEPLKLELRSILFQVFRKEQRTKSQPLLLNSDGHNRYMCLSAEPVPQQDVEDELVLVVFEDLSESEPIVSQGEENEARNAIIEQLEVDLKETRHRLQTIIEEYETSNEELKASNEELQSTNEELHSTTEELQTREEELQSANKELSAVNRELRNKIEELHQVNSDVENLIEATAIATIFLDRDLNLKRYTPRATELFHLIPADVGRPFDHISHEFTDIVLSELAERVLRRLESVEAEVQSVDGRWFQLRVLPYRTVDNRIDGVVLTFVDITSNLEAEQAAKVRAKQQAVVAELGQIALKGANVNEIIDVAVRQVAQVLDVEFCKVLELQPDGKELLLKGGVGWKKGLVGSATVGAGIDSQAGYTLEVNYPVIVTDLKAEKRFGGPPLLFEHGVVSGLSAVIQGHERPYGVMGAHTTRSRTFSEQDVSFLQAVANVLGSAVAKHTAEQERTSLLARVEAERSHLHTLFMQAPAVIAMLEGPEHVYTFANEWHEQLLGNREVIGRRLRDVLPELEGQSVLEDLDRVYETGKPLLRHGHMVHLARDADGEVEEGYFDFALQPILREDGSIEGVMSFAFEVTNEVRARKELEEERARLKAVLEQLPAGVIIAEAPSGQIVLDNERAAEIWRKPSASIKHVDDYELYDVFHADGTPYQVEEWPLTRAITSGEIVHNEEIEILRGDDTFGTISTSAAPIRNQAGEIVAAVVVLQDITKRKQMEHALRESERRFRILADTAPVMIWMVGEDKNFTFFNKPWLDFRGRSLHEELHSSWTKGVHPDDLDYYLDVYTSAYESKEPFEVEYRLRRHDGRYRWMLNRGTPRYTGDKVFLGYIGSCIDITERKESEAARERLLGELRGERHRLKDLTETLEERVSNRTAQVRALASALSLAEQRERERISQILHDDLQQLLHALHVQLLMLHGSEEVKQLPALQGSLEEVEALITHALDVTRALTVEMSPPILKGEGLEAALSWLASHVADVYGLHVNLDVSEPPEVIGKDLRELIFQLVRELLFNIVKHAEVDEAELIVFSRNERLVIRVKDGGVGFNLDEVLAQPEQAGFGLHSIRRRLDLFGGEMKIDSTPGAGTVVTIITPRSLTEG